ncbi:unnamed protein product [Fraxinus pennsylvanica]|uniref:Uncharacterized protein n=1 Tax=Fraxinus pennsylvanica TaxID=56036 RepID=A0AAD2DUY8_9LAMI|nr:unnamed protein product [Fraxinus pennsylvanica]
MDMYMYIIWLLMLDKFELLKFPYLEFIALNSVSMDVTLNEQRFLPCKVIDLRSVFRVAYLFTRTKKKDLGTEEAESLNVPSTPVSTSAAGATVSEKSPTPPPVLEPAKSRAPIPEDQQHELFKWMLEERRRMKPTDPEEKKRIDEEKALLKQFIRAKSIPSL